MEQEKIKQLVLNKLKNEKLGFACENDLRFFESMPDSLYELNEYGEPDETSWEDIVEEISGYVGDGAQTLPEAIDLWLGICLVDGLVIPQESILTTYKDKPAVPGTGATFSRVTENKIQHKLNEENKKSLNAITDMMQSDDFDAESKMGQIVIRTQKLFNQLSDNNYDVQVSFDNGESQSVILLGQEGGKVTITITDSTSELKAYASGNFEVNEQTNGLLANIPQLIEEV